MAGKRGGGENSKKALGQARKAETAANKKAGKEELDANEQELILKYLVTMSTAKK